MTKKKKRSPTEAIGSEVPFDWRIAGDRDGEEGGAGHRSAVLPGGAEPLPGRDDTAPRHLRASEGDPDPADDLPGHPRSVQLRLLRRFRGHHRQVTHPLPSLSLSRRPLSRPLIARASGYGFFLTVWRGEVWVSSFIVRVSSDSRVVATRAFVDFFLRGFSSVYDWLCGLGIQLELDSANCSRESRVLAIGICKFYFLTLCNSANWS